MDLLHIFRTGARVVVVGNHDLAGETGTVDRSFEQRCLRIDPYSGELLGDYPTGEVCVDVDIDSWPNELEPHPIKPENLEVI